MDAIHPHRTEWGGETCTRVWMILILFELTDGGVPGRESKLVQLDEQMAGVNGHIS